MVSGLSNQYLIRKPNRRESINNRIDMPQVRLVERSDVTDDLMVIKLEHQSDKFSFKPGQYCTLGLFGVERAYSIVSAPFEDKLEIFVELVPEGEMTPLMWSMKLGDTLSIRPRAKGLFVLDHSVHNHFLVATVTGVAPYISMIRQYIHDAGQGHVFYVLLGASYADELTYDTELSRLALEYPESIRFVPTVSRPDESRNSGWSGTVGRVNNVVEEFLARFDLPKEDSKIYACGHPGMIEDVKVQAAQQSWKFIEERFWKA